MDYIRARLEPLPTRADDPPPEPVDWARALVLYGAALTFALLAAMLWIVSPHAPTKPAAGVCLVIAVLLVCAQPALRVSLAHVRGTRIPRYVALALAAAAAVALALVFLGAWALWAIFAAVAAYSLLRIGLVAVRAVRARRASAAAQAAR